MLKKLAMLLLLALAACGDPAQFRPAKGVRDAPAAKTAYRVKESMCDSIGFVIKARSVDDIAETTANHGGTEYKILDDFGHTTVETDFTGSTVAARNLSVTQGHASSSEEVHHAYTAEAYRCP